MRIGFHTTCGNVSPSSQKPLKNGERERGKRQGKEGGRARLSWGGTKNQEAESHGKKSPSGGEPEGLAG